MIRFANRSVLRLALIGAALLPLAACNDPAAINRGMQSVHQPVVTRETLVYDVMGADAGSIAPTERARLIGWLDSLDVRYGDHVAIATDDTYVSPAMRESLAAVLKQRGMLIEEDSSADAGKAPYGAVRLIVRRSTASVPGCPDWRDKQEADMTGGMSNNYGCATNANFAAMIANPEDLVRGQTGDSITRAATSSKAARGYMDHEPSGIKALSGGN